MSLAALVTKATALAFTAAGDLVVTATWRQRTFGAYDVANGTRATTDTDVTVSAVRVAVTEREAARAGVSDRGVRLVILGSSFGAITPKKDDLVILGGVTYTAKEPKYAGTTDAWEVWADV